MGVCVVAKRDEVKRSGGNHIMRRRMRWAGHVARVGERRGVYRVLVRKPEEERPLSRPRDKWEYIKHLTSNSHYMGRTAQLTSICCILYIYSTNIRTEYFKHAA